MAPPDPTALPGPLRHQRARLALEGAYACWHAHHHAVDAVLQQRMRIRQHPCAPLLGPLGVAHARRNPHNATRRGRQAAQHLDLAAWAADARRALCTAGSDHLRSAVLQVALMVELPGVVVTPVRQRLGDGATGVAVVGAAFIFGASSGGCSAPAGKWVPWSGESTRRSRLLASCTARAWVEGCGSVVASCASAGAATSQASKRARPQACNKRPMRKPRIGNVPVGRRLGTPQGYPRRQPCPLRSPPPPSSGYALLQGSRVLPNFAL